MDRETDIFDADILENSSGDLDVDLVNAGQLLQKLAAEEGIDLDSLPDHVVEDLMRDIVVPQPHIEQPQETRKEASAMDQQTHQIPNEPTYADVAVELSKIASAEGINLDEVSREEYHEAFANLAERMADPEYGKQAQAEDEKLAAAYEQGQRMADGFLDRIKQAEDEDEKAKKEREDKEKAEKEKEAAFSGSYTRGFTPDKATKAKEIAKGLLGKGADKAREAAGKLKGAVTEHATKHKGKYTHAGAAAGGAAVGGGVGAVASRKKEALDEAALQVAQDMAREMGFDPTTGEKLAAATEVEVTEDEVAARAIEMLKESGYLPQE